MPVTSSAAIAAATLIAVSGATATHPVPGRWGFVDSPLHETRAATFTVATGGTKVSKVKVTPVRAAHCGTSAYTVVGSAAINTGGSGTGSPKWFVGNSAYPQGDVGQAVVARSGGKKFRARLELDFGTARTGHGDLAVDGCQLSWQFRLS